MPPKPKCLCGTCKTCKQREYMRGWYQRKTVEERRAWVAKRDLERIRERERATYAANVEQRARIAARGLVRDTLESGKLKQGDQCEMTGAGCYGPLEAHHDDYSRPLDVRWLCRAHHHEHHRTRNLEEGMRP